MKTYVNLKEYEYEVEALAEKDLWSVEELLEKILDMQETINELGNEKENLKNDFEVLKDNTRPLTEYEKIGMRESDF